MYKISIYKIGMKKIILLIMSCRDSFFENELEVIKETYASKLPDNIKLIYYDGNWSKTELDGNHLKMCVEDDIKNTFKKTYEALKYIINNEEFDYILRTNTSTYINIPLVNKFVDSIVDDTMLWCSELYSLSDGCCPYPLSLFGRGNCLLISKYLTSVILSEGLSHLYLRNTDDKTIGNIINSFWIKNGINYIDKIKCMTHGWYKCIPIINVNNHQLSIYGDSLVDYSNFISVQVKNYCNRELETTHFRELHKLFKNDGDLNFVLEYSKNPSVFIGSILGYIDYDKWLIIDKSKLYQLEINNKAIDDNLI